MIIITCIYLSLLGYNLTKLNKIKIQHHEYEWLLARIGCYRLTYNVRVNKKLSFLTTRGRCGRFSRSLWKSLCEPKKGQFISNFRRRNDPGDVWKVVWHRLQWTKKRGHVSLRIFWSSQETPFNLGFWDLENIVMLVTVIRLRMQRATFVV